MRVVAIPSQHNCMLKNKKHDKATTESWASKKGSVSVSIACIEDTLEVPPTESEPFKINIKGKCVEENVDYPNGSISKFENVVSLSACKKLCSKEEKCVRVVAIPEAKRCILKNADHEPQKSDTWVAKNGGMSIAMACKSNPKLDNSKPSVPYKVDISGPCVERGVDYPKGFIASFEDVCSLSKCMKLCRGEDTCVRIVAIPGLNRCILRNGDHEAVNTETWVAKQGSISLSISCKSAETEQDDADEETFDVDLSGSCVETGVDYPKGFIAGINDVTSLSKCKELCEKEESCVRIVAIPKTNRCILKNSKHSEVTKESWTAKHGAISICMECISSDQANKTGKEFDIDISGPCVEKGVDYPRGFISGTGDVTSVSQCIKLCSQEEACVRIVVFPKTNRCVLKNAKHDGISRDSWAVKQGSLSVSMSCRNGKPLAKDSFDMDIKGPCVERNIDYPGGFIAKFEGISSLSQCKELCSENKNCVRIVAIAATSLCLLKSSKHEPATKDTWVAKNRGTSIFMKCTKKSTTSSKAERKPYALDIKGACVEKDIDYPGGSIANIDGVGSLSECRELCSENEKCERFIALLSKRKCMLKSSDHDGPTSDSWVARSTSRAVSMKCLAEKRKKAKKTKSNDDFLIDLESGNWYFD